MLIEQIKMLIMSTLNMWMKHKIIFHQPQTIILKSIKIGHDIYHKMFTK